MRLEVIHLDEGLERQNTLLQKCAESGAAIIEAKEDAKKIRLWGWDHDLARIRERLPKRDAPTLSFLGSGDFHHVTALLLEKAAEFASEPFTVIHFDNHPDWVRFRGGMHCGSWVNRALYIPEVAKVITAGVCSRDLQHPEWKGANLDPLRSGKLEMFAYEQSPSVVSGIYGDGAGHWQEGGRLHWSCIAKTGIADFANTLLSRVATDAVYITLDKDVLHRDEAVTNWDQGKMRLDDIIGLVRELGGYHKLIGADVIGDYSPIKYAGGWWPVLKKSGESFIDQPRVTLSAEAIAAKNEAANIRLLDAFTEVMAA